MNESASPRKHPLRSCAVARYERHHSLAAIGHGAPRRYFAGLSVYFTERAAAALTSRLPPRRSPQPGHPHQTRPAEPGPTSTSSPQRPLVPRRLRAFNQRAKPLTGLDGAKCAIRSHLAPGNPT
jgi:hypothetical protein